MAIRFGNVGMDGALHVSKMMLVMLSVRVFSESHAKFHCSFVSWLYFNNSMSSSICIELVSKNLV